MLLVNERCTEEAKNVVQTQLVPASGKLVQQKGIGVMKMVMLMR